MVHEPIGAQKRDLDTPLLESGLPCEVVRAGGTGSIRIDYRVVLWLTNSRSGQIPPIPRSEPGGCNRAL